MFIWISNDLTVTGPEEVLVQLEEAVSGSDWGKEVVFSFEQIVPERKAVRVSRNHYAEENPDSEGGTRLPEFPDDPPLRHPSQWHFRRWGTDCEGVNPKLEESKEGLRHYSFGTPASLPVDVVSELAKLFPELRFEIEGLECAPPVRQIGIWEKGRLVEHYDYPGRFALEQTEAEGACTESKARESASPENN